VCAMAAGAILMYAALHISPDHGSSRFVVGNNDQEHAAPLLDPRGIAAPGKAVEDECGVIAWLKKNGGRVHENLEIADMEVDLPGGVKITRRGLRAKGSLAQGEEMVYVPENCMMTNATGRRSEIGWLFEEVDFLDDADILTLHLLYESRNPQSFFKPYICTMPKVAPQPMFFDAEQMASFKALHIKKAGEPAVWKMFLSEAKLQESIARQRNDFETRYASALKVVQEKFPKVFPKEKFTKEMFFWAYGMLSSRSFAWIVPGLAEGVYSMCPVADLPNRDRSKRFQQLTSVIGSGHDGVYSNGDIAEDTSGLALETATPVPEGRELFANYGEDCSEHFILNYGFVPQYCKDELLGTPVHGDRR